MRDAFPEVAIANKLATELLRLEQQFGMTPASRPNLEVATPPIDYDNPYSLGGLSRIRRRVRT